MREACGVEWSGMERSGVCDSVNWGKSGDSFWTSEDIEVGHFGSEENHGGYLGQGRRFRHFKQVRILKGVIMDTEGDHRHKESLFGDHGHEWGSFGFTLSLP